MLFERFRAKKRNEKLDELINKRRQLLQEGDYETVRHLDNNFFGAFGSKHAAEALYIMYHDSDPNVRIFGEKLRSMLVEIMWSSPSQIMANISRKELVIFKEMMRRKAA